MDWMKPIVSSIAPHRETLTTMNIKTQLYNLFERTSLYIDQIMGYPTHRGLVYEFLASFTVTHGETPFGEGSEWHFRIQNTNFTRSRNQAIYFLDFSESGVFHRPTMEQVRAFWKKLTDLDDFGPKSSPYSLGTSVWQYAHRLIATNINCQPESVDYVTLEDLELMWALDEGEPIDWFRVFSVRFLSMQHQYGPRRFVGCTSMITLIAKICGFEFLGRPYEHPILDFATWRKLCIIARPIELGISLTDVTEPNSWEDEPVDTEEETEEASSSEPIGKKQRIEIEKGKGLNDKVDWEKVSRVIVYEF